MDFPKEYADWIVPEQPPEIELQNGHTPLPYMAHVDEVNEDGIVFDPPNIVALKGKSRTSFVVERLFTFERFHSFGGRPEEMNNTAKFVVHACNNHYELLAEKEKLLEENARLKAQLMDSRKIEED